MEELYKSVEKLHTPDVKNSPRRETRYRGDPGCRNRGRHAQRCGSAVRMCTGINPYREITALARVDNAGKAPSGPPLSFALHSAFLLLCVADRSCVTSVPPPRGSGGGLCADVCGTASCAPKFLVYIGRLRNLYYLYRIGKSRIANPMFTIQVSRDDSG